MRTTSCIFLVVALLVAFVEDVRSSTIPSCALSHEILIPDLPKNVGTEKARKALEAEYHRIIEGRRKPTNVALQPENVKKNRYLSLPAYDETRVVLNRLPGDPSSDYINANYIDGITRPREYVATQGPLPRTVSDFWRMVWQLNATRILALANLIEHGKSKVAKYWPETSQQYGDITVNLLSEHEVFDHTLRTLQVKKGPQTRIVKQFHFTGWPDMGVPEDRLSFAAILQQAQKHASSDNAPIIVHCSAGVGRTGTAILIESMLQRARLNNTVDFLRRLDDLRNQRMNVVETPAQYLFAHDVVNDVYFNPAAEKYLKEIDDKYSQFEQFDKNNNFLS